MTTDPKQAKADAVTKERTALTARAAANKAEGMMLATTRGQTAAAFDVAIKANHDEAQRIKARLAELE